MKQAVPRPPIIGSFEDIGKDVAREVTKAPTDIGEKILESLTGSTGTSKQQNKPQQQDGALGKMEETKDEQVKKSIARAALQQLATPRGQEPPEYEQKKKEEQEKKEMEKKQKEKIAMQELPKMSAKKRRGDLYGIQGKSSSEKRRNVRQD